MKQHLKVLFIVLLSVIVMTGCDTRPSKKDAQKYLEQYLDEPYQITAEEHTEEQDIYDIYLPNDEITVHLVCEQQYNDAIHQMWRLNIDDYYSAKFLNHTDDREKLRQEKYPAIQEQVNMCDDLRVDTVDIFINSEEQLKDVYNYLKDCYVLNDFKYYRSYSMTNNQITSLYWQDFIGIKVYCSDKQLMFLYFSDLRQQEVCLPEELTNMITYEEFLSKIFK